MLFRTNAVRTKITVPPKIEREIDKDVFQKSWKYKILRVQNFDDLSSSPSRQWLTLSHT